MPIRLKKIFFGQYFFSGVAVAIGVVGLGLLAWWLAGPDIALAMATGSLCTSLVDVPGPARQKRREALLALTLTIPVTALMGLARPAVGTSLVVIMAVSFFAAMLTAYGRRAMPLSFAIFLAMVLALGAPLQDAGGALENALLFALGGGMYLLYATLVWRLVAYRARQQALSEALFAVAEYLRLTAAFFDARAETDAQYAELIRQQGVVAEQLQTAREFLLSDMQRDREARLASVLLHLVEVYENALSSHTDYGYLRERYSGSDVLMFLRDLSAKAALDVEQLSYSILRDLPSLRDVSYKAETLAIAHVLWRARAEAPADPDTRHALEMLQSSVDRIDNTIAAIDVLHRAAHTPISRDGFMQASDLALFLSPYSFSLKIPAAHFRRDSPILRYSLSTTLAMGSGFLLAQVIPYQAHAHWLLLTIAVIMRASFAAMRTRWRDRIVGNLAGSLFAALLLGVQAPTWLLIGVLFLAIAATHALATIRYRYAAVAACVVALLYIHFLSHDTTFVVAERLFDTVLGALLAYAFSLLLPNWEYRTIPTQVAALLNACGNYARLALTPSSEGLDYRLARKQLLDRIADLSAAFTRMLAEPERRRHSIVALNAFITTSYLFAAHLAAVRNLLRLRSKELDDAASLAVLEETGDSVRAALEHMEQVAPAALEPASEVDSLPPSADWTAREFLRQRCRRVRAEARRIAELRSAIEIPG
jgi:uncharacterized membrane protein YccC